MLVDPLMIMVKAQMMVKEKVMMTIMTKHMVIHLEDYMVSGNLEVAVDLKDAKAP